MFLYEAGVLFVMILKTLVKYETDENPSSSEISEIDFCDEISNSVAADILAKLV